MTALLAASNAHLFDSISDCENVFLFHAHLSCQNCREAEGNRPLFAGGATSWQRHPSSAMGNA
jgi:hypothetical protein